MTLDCPATMPRGPGSSRHTARSQWPTTEPATSCRGSPWLSGQAQPYIKRYTFSCAWPDASPRHHTAETPTSGPITSQPAGFSCYTPWYRPDCTTTLDINKYCYICVILWLSLSLSTILQYPTYVLDKRYRNDTGRWFKLYIVLCFTVC